MTLSPFYQHVPLPWLLLKNTFHTVKNLLQHSVPIKIITANIDHKNMNDASF